MINLSKKVTFLSLLAVGSSFACGQNVPEIIDEYCVKCHNFEDWSGSLDMEGIDFDHVEKEPEVWETMIRKVQIGMMPPPGEDKPDYQTLKNFAAQIADRLDENIAVVPASVPLHRLNRAEYANAIRDLFDLDIDVSTMLPRDNSSDGFDNIAASLGFSPALVQAYASAAMKISRKAVGDMTTTESSITYLPPPNWRQDQHIDGLPLGTRGGMVVTHDFPLDALYDINVGGRLFSFTRGRAGQIAAKVDITIDGVPIDTESTNLSRFPFTAGPHIITASIIDNIKSTGVNDIYKQYEVGGSINQIEIIGPFEATGPGNTSSREKIFSCYPNSSDEEISCAETIIEGVATRAFREPVTDNDIQSIMTFYRQGAQTGNFEEGIQQAISRVLIDPRFLVRFEQEPENLSAGEIYQISDLELASRLSFFLWSSIPDEELLSLAINNELSQPAVLEQQINRMLVDSKTRALVENFAGQWLFLRDVEAVTPEEGNFDDNLRAAFIQETQLLFANMVNEDIPVTELLSADYTFLNERLAQHYDIDGVKGSYFRKVALAEDSPRRGLIGHASILTVTSTASRTSPVVRGSWILENLLNAPVPAPPPGVETNLDGDGSTVITSSVRQRLEAHRADPVCSSCHAVIDPVGFSLENFDLVGQWREYDGDSKVDPSGTLLDGSKLNGPSDLRNALLAYSDLFVETVTEKLLTYALGRELEYFDMPTVRSIMKKAEANDFRFSSLIKGIINSDQFTLRVKSGNEGSDEMAQRDTDSAFKTPEA